MSRSHKVLGFLFVALLGVYGCARGPIEPNGAKPSAAEAKAQRLEEDFRTAAVARDSYRQRLLAAEEKQGHLLRQLEQANAASAQERQEKEKARVELKQRTTERDTLLTQYEGFRKNIRDLLGNAESALNVSTTSTTLVGTRTQTIPLPRLQN